MQNMSPTNVNGLSEKGLSDEGSSRVSALKRLFQESRKITPSSSHRTNFGGVLIEKDFHFDQSPLDSGEDSKQKGQEFKGFKFVLLSSECDITIIINKLFQPQEDLMILILSFSQILSDAESRTRYQDEFRIGDDVRNLIRHNQLLSEKLESLSRCIDKPNSLEKINISITFARKILTGFVEKQLLKSIIDDISKPNHDISKPNHYNHDLGLKIKELLDSISIEEDPINRSSPNRSSPNRSSPSRINKRSSIIEEFKNSVQSQIEIIIATKALAPEVVQDEEDQPVYEIAGVDKSYESSSDEEDQPVYEIAGDPKKIEQDPDRGLYTPYNTANNPQRITRVTIKKPLDEDEDVDIDKREYVDIAESIKNAIKRSITHMNRYFNPSEHDSIKIRFYKFFLIAIKVKGVSHDKKKYLEKLKEEFGKNEEFGKVNLENFYKKALMLSNAFQKEIIKFNIFTGRIGQDKTPKKDGSETEIAIVGMRSARIPIDLLTSIAHEELDEEQFREFCSSKVRLGLQKEGEELSSMPRTPQGTPQSELPLTVFSQRRGLHPSPSPSQKKSPEVSAANDAVQQKLFHSPESNKAQQRPEQPNKAETIQAGHPDQPLGLLQPQNGQPTPTIRKSSLTLRTPPHRSYR